MRKEESEATCERSDLWDKKAFNGTRLWVFHVSGSCVLTFQTLPRMGFNLQDKEMGSDYGADAFLLQAPIFHSCFALYF